MDPHDAQASLNEIHRLQDRTREEYVRYGHAGPYLFISALGAFLLGSFHDLFWPWNIVAVIVGAVLLLGVLIMQRRAPVRRRPTLAELECTVIWGFFLMGVYLGTLLVAALGTLTFGLPVPHVIAAAALALAILATAGRVRRRLEEALRREARRG